jgi:uncharacterized membrane protein
MNQHEINEREHKNPANWGSSFAFYHSKLDSRLWVPKQQAWMGWTLNLAHPLGKVLVLAFVLLLCLAAAAVVFAILPR